VRFWPTTIGVARVDTVLVDHTLDERAAESEAAGLTTLRTARGASCEASTAGGQKRTFG